MNTLEKLFENEFMQPDIYRGKIVSYEYLSELYYEPAEYFTNMAEMKNVERFDGTIARLSANGYLDCTNWMRYDDAETDKDIAKCY